MLWWCCNKTVFLEKKTYATACALLSWKFPWREKGTVRAPPCLLVIIERFQLSAGGHHLQRAECVWAVGFVLLTDTSCFPPKRLRKWTLLSAYWSATRPIPSHSSCLPLLLRWSKLRLWSWGSVSFFCLKVLKTHADSAVIF